MLRPAIATAHHDSPELFYDLRRHRPQPALHRHTFNLRCTATQPEP